jgi:catechol 2,3-dioxygenase-like lactoylglutathione lyase family enzyme
MTRTLRGRHRGRKNGAPGDTNGAMRIESLDHVALWVTDRETLAAYLCKHLGMHVIERTDRFTLVGADARAGKLTLFSADGEREPRVLRRVALRVSDLAAGRAKLPHRLSPDRPNPYEVYWTGPEGLGLGLVEAKGDFVEYDIDHVDLALADPIAARIDLLALGFGSEGGRVTAGGAFLDLTDGEPPDTEHPLLNHLGLRVASAEDHIAEATRRGLEIAEIVDAPNTHALFLWGPERIKLEYVEHKAAFALV